MIVKVFSSILNGIYFKNRNFYLSGVFLLQILKINIFTKVNFPLVCFLNSLLKASIINSHTKPFIIFEDP